MQQDDHIWAWRAYRFWKTGAMIRRIELDDSGDLKCTYIDPRDFYVERAPIWPPLPRCAECGAIAGIHCDYPRCPHNPPVESTI